MQRWQESYLGRREVPRELSEFDLQAFFTFSSTERAVIERRRGPAMKLGLRLHIGFVRMSGRPLDAFRVLPVVLLRHLGKELGMPWQATGRHPVTAALDQLRALYAAGGRTLPVDSIVEGARARLVRRATSSDRERALRAMAVATLFAWRRAVRNGSVWLEHSLSFRGRERLFLPAERWRVEAPRHYARLASPTQAKDFRARIHAESSNRAFLADYFINEAFRRELRRVLNRGEAVNALKRAIYSGRVAPMQARRNDEMQAVADALSLLANIIMAWNTSQMQAVLDHWPRQHHLVPSELIGRVAPTRLEGINLRGVFRFLVQRYAAQLLPSQTAPKTRASR